MKHFRTNSKEFHAKMEEYILNGINSEDIELKTPEEKLNYAHSRFISEFWNEYERRRHGFNKYSGFADYLAGLPFDFDFMNYKILELAKTYFNSYKDTSGLTPKQIENYENTIIYGWFNLLSANFWRLFEKYCKKDN